MYNILRVVIIIVILEGFFWGLDWVIFRRIIVKNNVKKRKMFELFIEFVLFFKLLEMLE